MDFQEILLNENCQFQKTIHSMDFYIIFLKWQNYKNGILINGFQFWGKDRVE